MKKILTIISFLSTFIIIAQVHSQNFLDSIYSKIDIKSDSTFYKKIESYFYKTYKINPTLATEIVILAMQTALNNGDSLNYYRMQNLRGLSIMQTESYFMALENFFKSYKYFLQINNKKEIANTLKLIGICYANQKIIDIAIEKLESALKIYQEIEDKDNIGEVYKNLSILYIEVDPQKSSNYIYELKKILENSPTTEQKALYYSFLGQYYLEQLDYSKALSYLLEAEKLYSSLNDNYEITKITYNIGEANKFLKNYNESNKYFIKSLKISKTYNIEKFIILNYLSLAKLYLETKNNEKTKKYIDSALFFCQNYNNNLIYHDIYKILSDLYSNEKNYKKSLEYLTKANEYLKKHYEENKNINISSFQINLELQNLHNKINEIQMQSQQQKLKMIQQQIKRNVIFISIIFILGLTLIIYMFIQTNIRKKINKELELKNKLLNEEITERKKAETEAIAKTEQYKLLFDKSPIGIIQLNNKLIITQINSTMSTILNKNIEDLEGIHINEIFERKIVKEIIQYQEQKNNYNLYLSTQIPSHHGLTFLNLTIKKYNIWYGHNEINGIIIIAQDITEQKRAEADYKINISQKLYLLNSLPDILVLFDEQEQIKNIHYPSEKQKEFSASKLYDLFDEETYTIIKQKLEELKEKNFITFSFENNAQTIARIIKDNSNNYLLTIFINKQIHEKDIQEISKDASKIQDTASDLSNEIKQELLPIYQNIQRGLSFILLKNFGDKIVAIGKKYNNNKLQDYGENLLDSLTSFNIQKINKLLSNFPLFINELLQTLK